MTTDRRPAYKPPSGFYKGYTFDKEGQVFADGKALDGIKLDVNSVWKAPSSNTGNGVMDSLGLGLDGKPKPVPVNPYLTGGGSLSRLSIDEKGNVFGEIGAPNTPTPTGVGTNGMGTKGPGMQGTSINPMNSLQPQQQYSQLNKPPPIKTKLTGIALDPARTSRSSGGKLGDNDAYLRADPSGAYFAQVNKGEDIVAYAYSALQQAQQPVGGPAQPSRQARRQGGNAGGGVSADAGGITLLGG